MAVVYVKEQRAVVRKRGARLLIEKEKQALAEIRFRETDSVAVFGNVQVTTQALSALLDEGIPLSFHTVHGRLKGHLVPEASRNVAARIAQYRMATDEEACLGAARRIVECKIANTRTVANMYRRHYPGDWQAEVEDGLARLMDRAGSAVRHDELLGTEGAAAALWFRLFGTLNRSAMAFPGREMHPSPDPINALLSLGYTMLGGEIRGLVEGAGLEPHIGFLHRIDYGRPSLALDVLEAFRVPVIDRLTLWLINNRVFQEWDFGRSIAGKGAGRVVLNPGEFGKYLEAYETALTTRRKSAPEGMRAVLQREVEKLKAWLNGGQPFQPWREDVGDVVPGEL